MRLLSIIILIVLLSFSMPMGQSFNQTNTLSKPGNINVINANDSKTPDQEVYFRDIVENFYPAFKKQGHIQFNEINELIRSNRGRHKDDEEEKETLKQISNLNIWSFNLKNKNFQQITYGGGYSYPRLSLDSTRISFIKNGKVGITDLNGKRETYIGSQNRYKRILGWSAQDEFLLIGNDNQVYRLRKTGHTEKVPIDDSSKYLSLAALKLFTEWTFDSKQVYAFKTINQRWVIVEDANEYPSPQILLEDSNTYLNPTKMAKEQLLFISDKPSLKIHAH